jgi:hypothetical protein
MSVRMCGAADLAICRRRITLAGGQPMIAMTNCFEQAAHAASGTSLRESGAKPNPANPTMRTFCARRNLQLSPLHFERDVFDRSNALH